jgi:agmatine deiminase
MIPSKETNTLYISENLHTDERYSKTCNSLVKLLDRHGIEPIFLKATKDIWCRDYMPIQIEKGKFVQFRYEPFYLKDDLELQSDPKEVCKENDINPVFSKINLDGGNVVNWSDRAIITDRVFDENSEYSNRTKLISEIEKLLQVEVIIIPQIKSDLTGHADGMVRFVDRNTVIGNDREHEYNNWKDGINKILKEKGINYIDIPFLDHKIKKNSHHAIGCYINYLEIKNLIILPIFEIENNKDIQVYDMFKQIFPDRIIETINYNDIGLCGGLLNCSTWTIKT